MQGDITIDSLEELGDVLEEIDFEEGDSLNLSFNSDIDVMVGFLEGFAELQDDDEVGVRIQDVHCTVETEVK